VVHLRPLDRIILRRRVEHLHLLGPRAVAEALAEIDRRIGGMPVILLVLAEYERLSPSLLHAVGGDRFPRRPLRVVPQP
jgi:hypothetical protein